MAAMPLDPAIDAGGTKTRCVLADETRVLARAETGTIKLMRVPEGDATARLRAMLAKVTAKAGISLSEIRRTCFGLAGIRSESIRAWASSALSEAGVGGEITICGDEEIALDAAFEGDAGILVIAGTGSHAIGRAIDGTLVSAGGWGPVLGDEGSGYWIGLEAVRAALRAHDAGDETAATLLDNIQLQLGVESLGQLVALCNLRAPCEGAVPPDFAALAPLVAQCGADGNRIACGILQRAGEELADLVITVYSKMPVAQFVQGQVGYTGSILEQIAPVRAAFRKCLQDRLPSLQIRRTPVDPLDGALWRARRDEG